ncbi:hypothetical protein CAPTEDRAFT_209013 [Capitella teleta]|uniref:Uncharacterized protein n=1 Tax=Capitella teleta TaxID=283909 RepID=R7V5S0_CAPTE|nr:hypothetical protein CAPTEDRAFT_209013 [Capitella teleta]|eukprot:ELU11666.1 hypothetical protein CAPTEDRAFT_209013 [Capitella teleta]
MQRGASLTSSTCLTDSTCFTGSTCRGVFRILGGGRFLLFYHSIKKSTIPLEIMDSSSKKALICRVRERIWKDAGVKLTSILQLSQPEKEAVEQQQLSHRHRPFTKAVICASGQRKDMIKQIKMPKATKKLQEMGMTSLSR